MTIISTGYSLQYADELYVVARYGSMLYTVTNQQVHTQGNTGSFVFDVLDLSEQDYPELFRDARHHLGSGLLFYKVEDLDFEDNYIC